nr:VOC family protein [candidate division Zixibacteria bacterium]
MNGFCHIEIPCIDMKKIAEFYEKVFGWEITMMPEMEYALFKTPAGPGGGFSKQAKIAKENGIALYIEVDDIDKVFQKIESYGGKKVQPKTQISPEFGYAATFADIEGNALGLWSKK